MKNKCERESAVSSDRIIVGNIISFCASFFLVGSCLTCKRKRVHLFQFFQGATLAVSQLAFGKGGGAVSMSVAAVRNLLICFGAYSRWAMIILASVTLLLGSGLNSSGIVGFMPVLAGTFYSVVSYRAKSILTLKLGLSLLLLVWTVYSAIILDVFGAITNGTGLLLNIVTLGRMYSVGRKRDCEDGEGG